MLVSEVSQINVYLIQGHCFLITVSDLWDSYTVACNFICQILNPSSSSSKLHVFLLRVVYIASWLICSNLRMSVQMNRLKNISLIKLWKILTLVLHRINALHEDVISPFTLWATQSYSLIPPDYTKCIHPGRTMTLSKSTSGDNWKFHLSHWCYGNW